MVLAQGCAGLVAKADEDVAHGAKLFGAHLLGSGPSKASNPWEGLQ
jgi:hypothetical protein